MVDVAALRPDFASGPAFDPGAERFRVFELPRGNIYSDGPGDGAAYIVFVQIILDRAVFVPICTREASPAPLAH